MKRNFFSKSLVASDCFWGAAGILAGLRLPFLFSACGPLGWPDSLKRFFESLNIRTTVPQT